MTEALVKKKRVRAGHRGVVTRRVADVEALLGEDSPDPMQIARLEVLLEEKLVTLRKLDGEVLELMERDEDIVKEIEDADAHNQDLQELLTRMQKVRLAAMTGGKASGSTVPGAKSGTSPSAQARLPKLTLPPFNGDIVQWRSFWELYEAAVHSNSELTNVQKFSYLKSLVQGVAKDAIEGLALTADSYQEAVDILNKRFGNRQKIIDKHMSLLLNMERVSSANNIPALRRLYDGIETNTRALKALGIPESTYGSLLSSVLVQRLPQDLRLIAGREIEGDWKLPDVLKVIGRELEARERTITALEEPVQLHTEGANAKKTKQGKCSVATLTTSRTTNGPSTCCYCQGNHSPEECMVVTQTDERRRILRSSGRCFMCLKKGHIVRECRSRNRCRACKGRHHHSVCQPQSVSSTSDSPLSAKKSSTASTLKASETTHLLTRSSSQLNPDAAPFQTLATSRLDAEKITLLQTAMVTLYNPKHPERRMEGIVVFDSGSQQSYVSQGAVEHLGLKGCGSKVLSIVTFGEEKGFKRRCEVIRIGIERKHGLQSQELTLLSVPFICGAVQGVTRSDLQIRCPQLAQLELADPCQSSISRSPVVLIGVDHYWSFVTGEVIKCDNGPVATQTTLGWVVSGPVMGNPETQPSTNLITHVLRTSSDYGQREEGRRLERKLKAFWDLESLGILDDDHDLYDQFHQVVEFRDNRYVVPLPWKDPLTILPDNYQLSLKRLRSLVRRLRQDPQLFALYNGVIHDQIEQGITEVVLNPNECKGDRVHYLPHHAVVKHSKDTTKVRVVYDASARSGTGISLNDALLVGPKFHQRIIDILLRFRCYQTALVADIEKAFLMVGVDEGDQDVLRFLWLKDWKQEPSEVQVLRFKRVVFGVASSPFLLNATIKHHLERYRKSQTQLVDILLESTYVDDVIFGAASPSEAFNLYRGAKHVFSMGGFNLRKFVSNDEELQVQIKEAESNPNPYCEDVESESYVKYTLKGSQEGKPGDVKVLGVLWRVNKDELVFDLGAVLKAANEYPRPTKRQVASIVGRVYDPLGILSPLVTPLKVFLQDLSIAKMTWDDPLSDSQLRKWEILIEGLRSDDKVTLPRYITESGTASYRLIGFGDASLRAYAAVVYLQARLEGTSRCQLLCSKSRVSPVEELTIPRLELLSALVLARLVNRVFESMKSVLSLEPPVCYLDSKVAYYWISGHDRSWKPFVQNRVREIRRRIPTSSWKHCPGALNPADAPSRGQTMMEFKVNSLWFHGPEFSFEDLRCEVMDDIPEECLGELKKEAKTPTPPDSYEHTLIGNSTPEEVYGIEQLMDLEKYSNLEFVLQVTAKVLRMVARFRRRKLESDALMEWLHEAERLWMKAAQTQLKADEAKYLKWKTQFNLFTDERGLIRCKGRLQNTALPYSTRFPLLLPRNHRLTLLLVRRAHEKVFHNGVKETLTELRSRYWIIKGRKLVQSVISRCVLCRRLEGCHYSGPPPPPLPTFRVEEASPFTYCGVDHAGPLFVKISPSSPCSSKVWICLFTCCTTRAVHLEVVHDLTTSSFLQCFRRFIARRGTPKLMISDNGKTFKGAARVLSNKGVEQLGSEARVEWNFNIERAPWWGGFFERLVRSVKRCLRKMIGRSKLQYEELRTLIVEIEAVINSRPLSFVSSQDLDEPLTPSHLLIGRRLLSNIDSTSPHPRYDEDYSTNPESLSRRTRFLKRLLDGFWDRWRKEYLIELRSTQASHGRNKNHGRKIRRGDVVIVYDDNQKRGFWRLGVVDELLPGRDEQIRGARVRVSVPGRGATIWRRPVERLYPLEVSERTESDNRVSNTPSVYDREESSLENRHDEALLLDREPKTEVVSGRKCWPRRQAAIQAEARIHQLRNMDLV